MANTNGGNPFDSPRYRDGANQVARRLLVVREALSLLREWDRPGSARNELTRFACLGNLDVLVKELTEDRPDRFVCYVALSVLEEFGSVRVQEVSATILAYLDAL